MDPPKHGYDYEGRHTLTSPTVSFYVHVSANGPVLRMFGERFPCGIHLLALKPTSRKVSPYFLIFPMVFIFYFDLLRASLQIAL